MELDEDSLTSNFQNDDCLTFKQDDLPMKSFPIFEQLLQQQRLCDVVLKVF